MTIKIQRAVSSQRAAAGANKAARDVSFVFRAEIEASPPISFAKKRNQEGGAKKKKKEKDKEKRLASDSMRAPLRNLRAFAMRAALRCYIIAFIVTR